MSDSFSFADSPPTAVPAVASSGTDSAASSPAEGLSVIQEVVTVPASAGGPTQIDALRDPRAQAAVVSAQAVAGASPGALRGLDPCFS